MDVVKQVFDNYINRTLAYDFTNHIGEYIQWQDFLTLRDSASEHMNQA